MSLDVMLRGEAKKETCSCFECGNEHEREVRPYLYDANITHNLGEMAEEAGIYEAIWRPEEIGIIKASQLIEPLKKGLELLHQDPDHFRKFNASNGWGLYEQFLPFVEKYLRACEQNPDAHVEVSR